MVYRNYNLKDTYVSQISILNLLQAQILSGYDIHIIATCSCSLAAFIFVTKKNSLSKSSLIHKAVKEKNIVSIGETEIP